VEAVLGRRERNSEALLAAADSQAADGQAAAGQRADGQAAAGQGADPGGSRGVSAPLAEGDRLASGGG